MIDVEALLERQASWQRSLRDLSWAEKLRRAAAVRESARQLRAGRERFDRALRDRAAGRSTEL